MRRPEEAALAEVAGARLDAALAALRQAVRDAAAAAGRVAALDAAVERQHAVIAEELEAPLAGPVLDRWGAWAVRERARLNGALALARAEVEFRREAAARAFGRAEALRLLAEEAAREARLKARRRG